MAPSVFTSKSSPYLRFFHYLSFSLFPSFRPWHSAGNQSDPIKDAVNYTSRNSRATKSSGLTQRDQQKSRDQADIRAIGYSHTCRLLTVDANHRFILELYKSDRVLCCGPIDDRGRRVRSRMIARKVVL